MKRKKKVKKRTKIINNKMGLIIKSNIRPRVKELDKDDEISSVSDEVETALERKVEDILAEGIKRAKANGRRTLQARDL
jgi:histone H3/H4